MRPIALLLRSMCVTALLAVWVPLASAGPFTQLIVFGDSLSDMGNVSQATFGFVPGSAYYSGRFSNGPVYAELLAAGLEVPLVRSRQGGRNYAHGGAKTTGTGGVEGSFILDIDEQVDQYLATHSAGADDLFVLFAGANDLFGGQTNVGVPVASLAEDLGRLVAAGARNILVPNLPLLGYTPRYNDNPSSAAQYNGLTSQFNIALDLMLDSLRAATPALSVFELDVAGLFSEALADPGAFGLVNVTDPAAPGLEPDTFFYDTSQIVDEPDTYLFWDEVHPTRAVHAILAERALALFALPGDHNGDGAVDAADYVVWRRSDGSRAGYNAWRDNFGASQASERGAGSFQVPEPSSAMLVLVCLWTSLKIRGCRFALMGRSG